MAPSHNDVFKPDNILFDGHRLWLVFGEAAFQKDHYADLAVVANMLVANEAEEQIYLQEYFGAPTEIRRSIENRRKPASSLIIGQITR